MKKSLITILAVFVFFGVGYAKNTGFLIGAEIGNGKVSASEIDKSGSQDDTIYSYKVGYFTAHQRFLLKGDIADIKDNVEIKTAFFEIDQVFSIVYIGLNLGQGGFLYEINSFIELEGNVRFSLTSISENNFDVDSWRVISAGLNIKF